MSFTFDNLPDNASSTVGAAGYTAGSGSLAVATGTGAVFGSSFPLQVSTFKADGTPKGVYRATGRSTDTLTGLTLIGGTDAALVAGDIVAARWTSEAYQALCTAINQVNATFASYAPLASPGLTGTPTAPTPATGDNSTAVATTAFVKAQSYVTATGAAAAAPVQSVAGRTGAVTIAFSDVSGTLAVAAGGTGGTTATAARANLGLDPTAGTPAQVFPHEMTFLIGGGTDVAVAANATGWRVVAGFAGKLVKWKVDPETNPSTGGFSFDILKNGASIFAAPIAVPANTTTLQTGSTFATTTVAEGDVFTPSITAAGTGVRYVTIKLYYVRQDA